MGGSLMTTDQVAALLQKNLDQMTNRGQLKQAPNEADATALPDGWTVDEVVEALHAIAALSLTTSEQLSEFSSKIEGLNRAPIQ